MIVYFSYIFQLDSNDHLKKYLKKAIFQGIFEKNLLFKVSKNSQENVFNGVPFKQYELSSLVPITILKTDFTVNVSL